MPALMIYGAWPCICLVSGTPLSIPFTFTSELIKDKLENKFKLFKNLIESFFKIDPMLILYSISAPKTFAKFAFL